MSEITIVLAFILQAADSDSRSILYRVLHVAGVSEVNRYIFFKDSWYLLARF